MSFLRLRANTPGHKVSERTFTPMCICHAPCSKESAVHPQQCAFYRSFLINQIKIRSCSLGSLLNNITLSDLSQATWSDVPFAAISPCGIGTGQFLLMVTGICVKLSDSNQDHPQLYHLDASLLLTDILYMRSMALQDSICCSQPTCCLEACSAMRRAAAKAPTSCPSGLKNTASTVPPPLLLSSTCQPAWRLSSSAKRSRRERCSSGKLMMGPLGNTTTAPDNSCGPCSG